MQEGLAFNELLVAGVAGALVVLCGGLYALFLALGYMHGKLRDRLLAYFFYFALCFSFLALARSLKLDEFWQAVIVLLLLAYLVSPHLIWKLTQATHGESHNGGSHND